MTYSVLIIEDNPEIAELVQLHLRDINCDSDIASDGEQGLSRFARGAYDLVVLDLMLPVIDGLAVCTRLREMPGYVPIIMLTSKSSELDRVLGLEMGADDYVTKPFSIPELIARVKAQFRRRELMEKTPRERGEDSALKTLHFGELAIDLGKRQVVIAGNKVDLTAKEYDLLTFFAANPGRPYSRAQLLDAVWGYSHEGYEHTVNSHINRLRAKIEAQPTHPKYILTVWSVGYKFTDDYS